VARKKATPKALAFAAKYRDDPAPIVKYLNDILSAGDPALIRKAIGDMVRAQGVTRFSQKAGVRRDNLYRTFKGELSPTFDRVMKVLLALDIQLIAKPHRPACEAEKALLLRRKAAHPKPTKPRITIAQVEGSGTAFAT
jgi:probable addiction module antidote protein